MPVIVDHIDPPAIVEQVRYRRGRYYYRTKKAPKAKPSTPAIMREEPKPNAPWKELCTEASPEFCGPEPPVVMIEQVTVNPSQFNDRWNAIGFTVIVPHKGDREDKGDSEQ